MILPVTLANCLALAGLATTGSNAALAALIALEQPALEFAIDPVLLTNSTTNPGLQALLTLGVSQVITGDYVISLFRQPQTLTLFKVSTLEIETRPLFDLSKIGTLLQQQGAATLAPFLQSARQIARTAYNGDGNFDDGAPVDLMIGSGLATPGVINATGAPPDPVFDQQLGTDGHTDPPSSDIFGFYGGAGYGSFGGSDL